MRPRLRVDAASLLVLAFFVYFSEGRFLAALLPAVAAHEAGHLLALKLLGRRVRGIALEPTGLRIDCAGAADPRGEDRCSTVRYRLRILRDPYSSW